MWLSDKNVRRPLPYTSIKIAFNIFLKVFFAKCNEILNFTNNDRKQQNELESNEICLPRLSVKYTQVSSLHNPLMESTYRYVQIWITAKRVEPSRLIPGKLAENLWAFSCGVKYTYIFFEN